MVELHGALFLAEPENFDDNDEALAGIERFDTATSTTRLLVNEKDLGGSVAELAVTDGCGVAIVAGKQKDVRIPRSARARSATLASCVRSARFRTGRTRSSGR